MAKDGLQSSLRKCEECGVTPQRRETSVGGSMSGKEALKATVRSLGSAPRPKGHSRALKQERGLCSLESGPLWLLWCGARGPRASVGAWGGGGWTGQRQRGWKGGERSKRNVESRVSRIW